MVMTMLFPKEERLLLGAGIIILLCIPVGVLSLVSNSLTLLNYGQIRIPGREYSSSTFTYRIFQNSTSTYRINSTGFVDDHYGDPAVVINNAMLSCSSKGGGLVYVAPDTYNTTKPIGYSGGSGTKISNVILYLGDGTIINRTAGTGEGDFMFVIRDSNLWVGVFNFTLTSNGTAYFNGNGYSDGFNLATALNCTVQNVTIQHTAGVGVSISRARYCHFENISVFSWDESVYGGAGFGSTDIAYSTFKNITLDGNNNPDTRGAFYFGDWDPTSDGTWNGSYFNTVEKLWCKNFRRSGIYLNSGAFGWQVYNNTFTNCTIENQWERAYDAIKLRPCQNCTFTDIVIRNCTDPVTTGTSYDGSETRGNCTGNSVTATIYDSTWTSFILTTDGNNQSVDHNFFNFTIINSRGTYFSSGTNSPIHDNICYLNMTNSGGLSFESGYIQNNMFVMNFLNCGVDGHADIRFPSPLDPRIANNLIYILSESGNPHGQLEGSLGTNQIINGPP
jgi:hypothetical protein